MDSTVGQQVTHEEKSSRRSSDLTETPQIDVPNDEREHDSAGASRRSQPRRDPNETQDTPKTTNRLTTFLHRTLSKIGGNADEDGMEIITEYSV